MENYHVVKQTKSVGIGILLTLLLGPIGLFYATIWGGIVMTFLPALILGVVILGAGSGGELLMIIGGSVGLGYLLFHWLICMIWAARAIKQYNNNLINKSKSNVLYYPGAPGYFPVAKNDQFSFHQTNFLQPGNPTGKTQNIQEWLKSNPTKGINDYYSQLRE